MCRLCAGTCKHETDIHSSLCQENYDKKTLLVSSLNLMGKSRARDEGGYIHVFQIGTNFSNHDCPDDQGGMPSPPAASTLRERQEEGNNMSFTSPPGRALLGSGIFSPYLMVLNKRANLKNADNLSMPNSIEIDVFAPSGSLQRSLHNRKWDGLLQKLQQ